MRDCDGAGHLSWLKGRLDTMGRGTEKMGQDERTFRVKVLEGVSWKDGLWCFQSRVFHLRLRGRGQLLVMAGILAITPGVGS